MDLNSLPALAFANKIKFSVEIVITTIVAKVLQMKPTSIFDMY